MALDNDDDRLGSWREANAPSRGGPGPDERRPDGSSPERAHQQARADDQSPALAAVAIGYSWRGHAFCVCNLDPGRAYVLARSGWWANFAALAAAVIWGSVFAAKVALLAVVLGPFLFLPRGDGAHVAIQEVRELGAARPDDRRKAADVAAYQISWAIACWALLAHLYGVG